MPTATVASALMLTTRTFAFFAAKRAETGRRDLPEADELVGLLQLFLG